MKRALLALLLCGCTERTQLIPAADGGSCNGSATPVRLGATCAATLAADSMRQAICVCDSLVLAGNLTTDAPSPPPPMPGQPPRPPSAGVATNGSLQVGGLVQIAGDAIAASTSGMSFSRTASILGSLRSDGSVAATQLVTVGDDAFVGGDVLGRVDVGGMLHVSPASNLGPMVSADGVVHEAVTVDAPCGCDTPVVDAAALAAAAAHANDDAAIALAPDALAHAAAPTLDLPCGQYYLSSLSASGPVALRVHGKSALFVGGDVTLAAGMQVALDDDAELDLVVAGNLDAEGGGLAGDPAPSLRVWLGGATLRVGSGAVLSAAVYAPAATLVAAGALDVTGAIFVGSVSAGDDVTARFDPALLDGGNECGDPAATPSSVSPPAALPD